MQGPLIESLWKLINFSLPQKWIKVPLTTMLCQEPGAGSHSSCTFKTSPYDPMHDTKLK